MPKVVRFAANLLALLNLRHDRDVVRSALCGALVRVSAFWIRHLLLLSMQRVLAEPGVELHELQPFRGVPLVLCGRVIILVIFRAHDPDDFSCFALLSHGTLNLVLRQAARATCELWLILAAGRNLSRCLTKESPCRLAADPG